MVHRMRPLTRLTVLFASFAAVVACERSVPLNSLRDDCGGVRVVRAHNRMTRDIEVFARADSVAAISLGFLPADTVIEFTVPAGATGVFMFPIFEGTRQIEPNVTFTYRCERGRPEGPNA